MIQSFENYTLLAGNHGRRGSVWRGPDHLLVIEGSGALYALSESYRRIDYENIQALALVRTQRYGWLLAAFIAPLVLMAIILFVMMAAGAGGVEMLGVTLFLGVPLVLIPFVLLVVHVARGRTVHCNLQTAVQNLRLRPLTREAKAQRVMAEIAELCSAHQGGAVPRAQDATTASPPWQAAPTGTRQVWNGSPVVIAAGMLVFVWGGMLIGEPLTSGTIYFLMDLFLGMVANLTTVIALVFALRYHSPSALLAMLWTASGLGLLIGFCALGGFGFVQAMLSTRSGSQSGFGDSLEHLADISLAETPAFGWIVIGLGILIGILGLAMLPYGARRRAAPTQSTPPLPS